MLVSIVTASVSEHQLKCLKNFVNVADVVWSVDSGSIRRIFNSVSRLVKTCWCTKTYRNTSIAAICRLNTRKQGGQADRKA